MKEKNPPTKEIKNHLEVGSSSKIVISPIFNTDEESSPFKFNNSFSSDINLKNNKNYISKDLFKRKSHGHEDNNQLSYRYHI